LGQDYAGASSENSDKKYTVSGIVVNAVTGEPVPRALVEIYAMGQRAALTNAEGHFEFSGLRAMDGVSIAAQKPGFFAEQQVQHRNGVPVTIRVGPDTPAVIIKLVPGSEIVGRITSNGEPLEDVPVKVLMAEVQDGHKQWGQLGSTTSDDEGEFRIAGLLPGEYYLEVGPKAPDIVEGIRSRQVSGYGRVFYPNAPELESGSPMVLGMGQRAEADFSLKQELWYRVSGMVRGVDPTANISVRLVGGGDVGEGSRLNRGTAEFETRAPAGNYRLEVEGFSQVGIAGIADVPVTVNSDVSGLQVAAGPAPAIPIEVKAESTGTKNGESGGFGGTGTAVYRNGSRSVMRMSPVSISLRPSGFSEAGMEPVVSPNNSGKPETLAVRNLMPGNYWVEIGKNPPWYVQSAICGSMDLLRERLAVTGGPPCAAIEVVLRDDGATLSASGTWEGEPTQATMLLLPEQAPEQATTLPVGKGGEAQFEDLAPGNYSVLLMDGVDGLEYKNPEAMSGYMSKAAHVTLSPNQRANLSVEMVRR
jgi:hypothetical protein